MALTAGAEQKEEAPPEEELVAPLAEEEAGQVTVLARQTF